ncbi:hypothetical protein NLG97_g1989 [Lecanicillium saksenae]|uniref:Uncharacterized protein n=1 Tax=Lecanicillium saksenae TaxID=468837 RepID=A0ACC1R253_9HYPO|nr:hypothetical protein NLG97_g1989 [Lecanicillium saksenae]
MENSIYLQAAFDGGGGTGPQAQIATKFASCDETFGPWAIDCRNGRFDFTFLFEQAFFAILPSGIFLAFSLIRIGQLVSEKQKVKSSTIAHLKLIACLILVALQIAIFCRILQLGNVLPSRKAALVAAGLAIADAFCLTFLSGLEHFRTIKPSTLITVYLICSTFFDIARCRTLWLVGIVETLASIFTAGLGVKVTILCLEAQNKRNHLNQDWKIYGQESTGSAVSNAMLWWVNSILWKGYMSFLKLAELPELEPGFRSKHLLPKMLQEWERCKNSGKHALLWALIRTSRSTLIMGAIPRVMLSCCKLVVPFFVARVISYVSDYSTSQESGHRKETGYSLVAATGLLFLTQTLVAAAYEQAKTRTNVMMRSALTSTILHYAVQMEPGEKEGSASLTLVTADVSRAVSAFGTIHELWVTPIEVILATGLLARQVGYGSTGPLLTVIMTVFVTGVMSKYIGPAQMEWMQSVQRRISDTTSVLGSMKEVKMLGLVVPYTSVIEGLLENELTKSLAFRKLLSLLNVAGKIPDTFAPPITFGLAILFSSSGRLSISEAFTSLSILALIMAPLQTLTHSFPFAMAALPCFKRIQDFIELCSSYEARVSVLGASTEVTSSEVAPLLPGLGQPLFALEKSNVSVKTREEPLIRDATVQIFPGTFNLVAGKVGTGKTTLLKALLGQLGLSGNARVRIANVAYCSQTPWLITGTAKDNIICKSNLDEAWYKIVVTACGLDRDFSDLPRGDGTPIGSKGVSLSGGQKQRISLARAVFSRKQIVFVDDILSGLDWTTQRFVWKEVFGPLGLLRKNNITVVLATHALHLVESPDSVILLGANGAGSISQGTLEELMETTNIRDLVASSHGEHEDAASSEGRDGSLDAKIKYESIDKIDDAEAELLRKSGDLSLYLYYWNTIGWDSLFGFLGTSLLCAGWPILPQIWLMWWTEANESMEEVQTSLYFWVFALLSLGKIIAVFIAVSYCMVVFAPKGLRVLHSRMLATTMSAPLSFFVATPPGDLVNRFSRDIQQVDVDLPMAMFVAFLTALTLLRSIALVMFGSVYMGIIIIPMMLFVYLLQKFYLQTSRQLRYLDLQSSAPLNTHLIEVIDGAATIQAFGWQESLRADGLDRLEQTMKPYYLLRIIQVWLELVMGLFVSVVSVLLITTCVALPSSTSAGGIALSLTNLLAVGGALSFLVLSWTSLETSFGAADRIRAFERSTPKEIAPNPTASLPPSWPVDGKLSIQSISASYKGIGDNSNIRALDRVNFEIQPGTKVAICGRTGSGKSSLLLALFRMLDLESGSISIDGIDISAIPQTLLRSRMISVPQQPILLPGTLRFNLLPERDPTQITDADDEALVICLQAVGLWEELDNQGGLNSQVSDLQLSHGQKQLLCLARALAKKDTSSILILDEAMSSVDKQNEELMVKVIEEHFSQHTIISVVHRLNTVSNFDQILLLDRGAIAEFGSPTALLAKENGRFKALWEGRES